MKLNSNQLAFILDAMETLQVLIDCYEGYGDFTSSDGKYSLTEDEVDELISMIADELISMIADELASTSND